MPRPRSNPLFELGGQWIAREQGSRSLYRFWNDARNGRTRRESLRTASLEEAKRQLAEIVVKGAPKTAEAFLSVVLESYISGRLNGKPSQNAAKYAATLMLDFWGETVRVRSLTEETQRQFADWSAAKGHSLSYIARNLRVLRAALSNAKLHEPEIIYTESRIQEEWRLATKPPRSIFIPSDAELGRFLSCEALPESAWRWCLIALSTGCRPQAATDLRPAARRRDARVIDLNPDGRPQNKKFRPRVRETRALTGWLDSWENEAAKNATRGEERLDDRYTGYASVESVQTAIERIRAREEVALPRLSAYSFRHKVITVLRLASVSEDETGRMVGHQRSSVRTTAGYGEWSPDYLKHAVAALDAWLLRLQKHVTRPLFSQRNPKFIRRQTKAAA